MRGVKTKATNKWKRLGLFLVLVLVFGLLLNSVSGVYKKKKGAELILARTEAEAKVLVEREAFLKESLKRLGTKEGLKSEIRKKLNVAEVGESVAVIVTEERVAPIETFQISTWQKIKNFFTSL